MIKMNLNIQLFASKKGVGSTKNGRAIYHRPCRDRRNPT